VPDFAYDFEAMPIRRLGFEGSDWIEQFGF
jgi:hypothetical protein